MYCNANIKAYRNDDIVCRSHVSAACDIIAQLSIYVIHEQLITQLITL